MEIATDALEQDAQYYPSDKSRIQDDLYSFPYHHIPHFDEKGIASQVRVLSWGFEYLCYLEHIRELANFLQPRSVLDVGCGDGRFIGMLSDRIDPRVGVDLSKRAIRFAQAFHPDIDFRAIDASELDESFDLVVAIEVLEHVPDQQTDRFLRALAERTDAGGHVIISVPTKVFPVGTKHYRHYDLRLLQKQLASSGAPLALLAVDYVYRDSFIMELFKRLSQNRIWTMEVHSLQRLIWNYTWNKLRKSSENDGKHLVATLQKIEANDGTENTASPYQVS